MTRYTSASTSIRRPVDPATGRPRMKVLRAFHDEIVHCERILDYGAGKYDDLGHYLEGLGVEWLPYDPYNRPEDDNNRVLAELQEIGGRAKGCVLSGVLNVVQFKKDRRAILEHVHHLCVGPVFISVYNRGKTGPTGGDRYQVSQSLDDWLLEVQAVFPRSWKQDGCIYAVL